MELLEALQKSSITLEQLKVCEMFRLQSFIYIFILFFFCHGVRIDGTGIAKSKFHLRQKTIIKTSKTPSNMSISLLPGVRVRIFNITYNCFQSLYLLNPILKI